MASFEDAYYGGADFLEMDLQITKDGQAVCQHDSYLDVTTNVAQYEDYFKDRKRVGEYHYYVNDFTMAELKTFKRRQRYPDRSQLENDKYEMVTLEQVIENVRILNENAPRTVNSERKAGLYIELKDYKDQLADTGYDLAELAFGILSKHGLGTIADCESDIPIIIQSFEFEALQKFATLSDLPLVMLTRYTEQ